jgi:hypothetical protein
MFITSHPGSRRPQGLKDAIQLLSHFWLSQSHIALTSTKLSAPVQQRPRDLARSLLQGGVPIFMQILQDIVVVEIIEASGLVSFQKGGHYALYPWIQITMEDLQ